MLTDRHVCACACVRVCVCKSVCVCVCLCVCVGDRDRVCVCTHTPTHTHTHTHTHTTGGSTAFRFAALHPHRVRNIALLAPALMLHDDMVSATAASAASGNLSDIVYNYRTEQQALEMCALVGWPESTASKLAPMLAAAREGHPPEFWANIWLAFAGAYQGSFAEGTPATARPPMDLFLSHMQGVMEHGAKLRASGRRVLVVQVWLTRANACACTTACMYI